MKRVGIALSLVIVAVLSMNGFLMAKTGWEEHNLKGKVKERILIYYKIEYKNGEPIKIMSLEHITKYNINGYKYEDCSYKADKALKFMLKYNYDDRGKLIEELFFNERIQFVNKKVYKYDDDEETLIEELNYDAEGELRSKKEYKYDDNGNLIKDIIYNIAGMPTSYTEYKYDNNRNRIEWAGYLVDKTLIFKIQYTYDENGNWIETANYDKNGTKESRSTCKYDDKGNEIEWIYYDINAAGDEIIRTIVDINHEFWE